MGVHLALKKITLLDILKKIFFNPSSEGEGNFKANLTIGDVTLCTVEETDVLFFLSYTRAKSNQH